MKRIGIALVILCLASGCIVVGGYSSERGWYLWPGTFGIFVVLAVFFLFFKRRK